MGAADGWAAPMAAAAAALLRARDSEISSPWTTSTSEQMSLFVVLVLAGARSK